MAPLPFARPWSTCSTAPAFPPVQASSLPRNSGKEKEKEKSYALKAEVVVAPPAIYVDRVRQTLKKEIGVAAQNAYVKPSGAYTGEIRYGYVFEFSPIVSSNISSSA